uniref:hypothetical protein n=1 Tax=Marinimicrobium sp. UBA4509 TaxID=1946811 RepID=UPI00257E81FC
MKAALRLASCFCLGSLALCPVTLLAQDDQDREKARESITIDRERAAELRRGEAVQDTERKTAVQTLDRTTETSEVEQERPIEEAEAQPQLTRPVPAKPREAEVIEREPEPEL